MANESTEKPVQGITAITVSGFKSLRDESRIEVRPLTILAGANSSGKSSIMQPLLLMKQTLEAPYDPGPLLLNGPNVKFTSAEQFLSELESFQTSKVTIKLNLGDFDSLEIKYGETEERHLKIEEAVYEISDAKGGHLISVLRPEMTEEQIIEQFPSGLVAWRNTYEQQTTYKFEWRALRNRCFLGLGLFNIGDDGSKLVVIPITTIYGGYRIDKLSEHIHRLIHVPGLRGNPERAYNFTPAVGPMFQNTFVNYVASVIYQWQENQDRHLDFLERNLLELGLASKVAAKRINDVQIELRIGRTLRREDVDLVSIADVGFGVSQVLPVLVALLVAEPGQLVYIEQPELHLHPRAQVALAQVLADAANRGVRVVAETHSALLIQGIQTLVAKQALEKEKVILHWFQRDDDGCTKISSQELNEYGAYNDFWPEDFAEVQLEADSAYLDAVENRRLGELDGGQKPEMSGD